jgi:hypothetical protein
MRSVFADDKLCCESNRSAVGLRLGRANRLPRFLFFVGDWSANRLKIKTAQRCRTMYELFLHELVKALIFCVGVGVPLCIGERDLVMPKHINQGKLCRLNRKVVLTREAAFLRVA